MSLPIALIVLGLIAAIVVSWIVGVIMILVGVVWIILDRTAV